MVLEHSFFVPARYTEHSTHFSGRGNNSLPELVEYYLVACRVEGKSPRTLTSYAQRLNDFLAFAITVRLLTVEAITPHILRLFLLSLQERKLCANTSRAYYRALHSFLAFLIREGIMQDHPMSNIRPPKVPRKIVRPLTTSNIMSVLAIQSSHGFINIRNRALFLMFLDTGLRLDEMAGIQMDRVDINSGTITVMGKGSKERKVPLGKMAQAALLRYWLHRRDSTLPGLWITEEKHQMKRAGVQMSIRRMLRLAGCEGVKIGPHTLRHTAAINYLRNGGDLATLQILLGQADISTTKMYLTSLAADDVMRVHATASPVDNLHLK